MTTIAAHVVSAVLAPEVVFLLGVLALAARRSVLDLLPALVFAALIAFFTGAYRYYGWTRVRKFSVLPRQHRLNLYISALFACGLGVVLFGSQAFMQPFWMYVAMVCGCYSALFILVNSYFDKASQHVGMLTLWAFMLMESNGTIFSVLLLALPPVMWSRLILKRHTWVQMWWGGRYVSLACFINVYDSAR